MWIRLENIVLQKDAIKQRREEVITERPQDLAGNWIN